MLTTDIAKIIRSLCYVHIQSVEGTTLPTEDIADVHVGGIDIAAEEIARRCSPDSAASVALLCELQEAEQRGYVRGFKLGASSPDNSNDRLRDALQQIEAWSRAYPLKVFPEPDMTRVRELLEAGGITLDAVSASNMRHVIEGVGKIASDALTSG
jgi:hypothetical protein